MNMILQLQILREMKAYRTVSDLDPHWPSGLAALPPFNKAHAN